MDFNTFMRSLIEKNFNPKHHDTLEQHYFELFTGRRTKCSKFDTKFMDYVRTQYKKQHNSTF